MGYYVVHPGGQQYGPADIATLNSWAAEGRLIPDTTLIDAATGAHVFARDVSGLFFPLQPQGTQVMPGPAVGTPLGGYSTPPSASGIYNSPYPRQSPLMTPSGSTAPAVTASYIASGLGILLVCCAPFLTVLAGLIGVGLAASAKSVDPARAKGAMWVGAITCIVGLGFTVGMFALGRMTSGGG